MNVIYQRQEYSIIQGSDGYVIRNSRGTYENHSHFSYSIQAAKDCIKFAIEKIVPKKSKYMAVACKRISLDEDYKEAIDEYLSQEKKRRYYNHTVRR